MGLSKHFVHYVERKSFFERPLCQIIDAKFLGEMSSPALEQSNVTR